MVKSSLDKQKGETEVSSKTRVRRENKNLMHLFTQQQDYFWTVHVMSEEKAPYEVASFKVWLDAGDYARTMATRVHENRIIAAERKLQELREQG